MTEHICHLQEAASECAQVRAGYGDRGMSPCPALPAQREEAGCAGMPVRREGLGALPSLVRAPGMAPRPQLLAQMCR